MRTRHEGPGVGRHRALGVTEPGSPTRRNPTLRPSPSVSDAATTRRRRGAPERLPTTHIAHIGSEGARRPLVIDGGRTPTVQA